MESLVAFYNANNSKFAIVGAAAATYVLCKFVWSLIRGIAVHFVCPAIGLTADLKKAGEWAVVTGCTDGIGKEYAFQIAKKGVNVVLISRTLSKLDELAKEIESKYTVKTRTIAVDFTNGNTIYEQIREGIKGLEIGTLVNNVGMGYQYPEYFSEIPDRDQFLKNLINVNITSVTMMTSLVLPDMLARRRGYIINISSSAGESSIPLLTVYSATKVFVDYFSKGLQEEYCRKGITVQVIRPHFVATKLSGIRKTNVMIPSPRTYVNSALAVLGVTTSSNGYWAHSIQSYVMECLPSIKLTHYIMSKTRKSALKRIARHAKKN